MERHTNSDIEEQDSIQRSLATLVDTADAWLDENASQFDPLIWSDTEVRFLRRKAFAEAAIYLHRAAYSDIEPSKQLRSTVLDYVNTREFRHLLARKPDEITMYGYPIVYAADIGELSDETAEIFERTLKRPDVWATEVVPFRKLDMLHLCKLYGIPLPVDISYEEMVDRTCASHQVNPATISIDDVYGLTHVLMYYQNFGSGHEAFADAPLPYQYPEVLHGLLLRYIAAENCDLVGELLICGALEQQLPRGLARFALSWYFEQTSDDGYVPYPNDDLPIGSKRGGLKGDLINVDLGNWDEDSESWAKHYHPTLVGATLGRVLSEDWSEIDNNTTERDLDYESEAHNLLKLGRAFELFAEYKIEEGAKLIEEFAETDAAAAYSDVLGLAVQFLEWQRRSDEKYGYWTDEKKVFLAAEGGHTPEQFETELIDPLSEQCRRAIETAEDVLGAGNEPIEREFSTLDQ